MMRLRVLHKGTWKVLALVSEDGSCDVENELDALASDKKTKATAAGFKALWSRIPPTGPRGLGTDNYHRVDDENEINQFIRRQHRILCFEADGCLIVCSHMLLKQSSKTPSADRARAAEFRKAYKAAVALGSIEILDDDEEGESADG